MSEMNENDRRIMELHGMTMSIHARVMACHCECLAMNALNCERACRGEQIAYDDGAYFDTMQKWGLIDSEGKPLI